MAQQARKNNVILWVLGALIAGGIVGYIFAQSTPLSRASIGAMASAMKEDGSFMMQMGSMMVTSGAMMQQKGQKYSDQEMIQQGKALEENGTMLQRAGTNQMDRGSGIMQTIGQ